MRFKVVGVQQTGERTVWHSDLQSCDALSPLLWLLVILLLSPDHDQTVYGKHTMLLQWLLLTIMYYLPANAVTCEPMLGTSIRTSDCHIALNLFISKLKLIPPYNAFETVPNTFARHHLQDARYDLPQGAQFESCAIAVDLSVQDNMGVVATWRQLFLNLVMLISRCPDGEGNPTNRLGLGGTISLGPFVLLVVDPGPGMRNVLGTCMYPRPPQAQNVLWHLTERLCGFQTVSSLWPAPDRSQLPQAPAPFDIIVTFGSGGPVVYSARGQWIWNGDVWSPSVGNAFLRRVEVRHMWVLITQGFQHNIPLTPPAFSRTVPRVMAAVWAQLPNGVRVSLRGAWGSHRGNWLPLAGDISNMQQRLQQWDWVLVEFGSADPDQRATSTSSQQPSATSLLRLLMHPGETNLDGPTTATSTSTIPRQSRDTSLERFISFQRYRMPSITSSRLPQRTLSPGIQAAGGLSRSIGFDSNRPAQGSSSSRMKEPSMEFRSPGSIPRPMPAAGGRVGLDSAFAAGEDDYPSSSNLGLSPGFFLPLQGGHLTSTANDPAASVFIPPHLRGTALNAWVNEVLGSIHARPSKRPRPNP